MLYHVQNASYYVSVVQGADGKVDCSEHNPPRKRSGRQTADDGMVSDNEQFYRGDRKERKKPGKAESKAERKRVLTKTQGGL